MNPIQGLAGAHSASHSNLPREHSAEHFLKPLQRAQILPVDQTTPQGVKLPSKINQRQPDILPLQVGRTNPPQQLMYGSPSAQVPQVKKNAYMGYLQLQSMQNQQINHGYVAAANNLNQSKAAERSIEQSKGIAGVGLNPSQSTPILQAIQSQRIKHIKKKGKSGAQTQREIIFDIQSRGLQTIEQATGSDNNLIEDQEIQVQFLRAVQQPSEGSMKSGGGVGAQRKLTRVQTTDLGIQGSSPSAFTKTQTLVKVNNAGSLIDTQQKPNQNISNVISMLKQKERVLNFPNSSTIDFSNPGSSKSNISSLTKGNQQVAVPNQSLSGLNIKTKKTIIPQKQPLRMQGESLHQHRYSNGKAAGDQQTNTDRTTGGLVGNEIISLKPQNEHIDEDYIPLGQQQQLQVHIGGRKNLSQSPQSINPALALYGLQGSTSQLLRNNINGHVKLQIPRGANFQGAGIINLGNLSGYRVAQEDETNISYLKGIQERSQSLGKKSQVVNVSQFRKRNGSSLKRESQQLSKSSLSQKNLYENMSGTRPQTIANNFSTTQRSIQIYRNAVKNSQSSSLNRNDSQVKLRRESLQASGIQQQSDQEQQMIVITSKSIGRGGFQGSKSQRIQLGGNQNASIQGLKNAPQTIESMGQGVTQSRVKKIIGQANTGGFIDRTIKTSTSQFISPKTTIQQINKGMFSGGAMSSTQSIQFFNNQISHRQSGPFGPINAPNQTQFQSSIHDDTRLQLFAQCNFVKNLAIRITLKQWRANSRQVRYNFVRQRLSQEISFGQDSKLTSLHLQIIQIFQDIQDYNYFDVYRITGTQIVRTQLHDLNEQSIRKMSAIARQLASVNYPRANTFLQTSLASLVIHLKSIHENLSDCDKIDLKFTLNGQYKLFPTIELQVIETYLKQMTPAIEQFIGKLNWKNQNQVELQSLVESDIYALNQLMSKIYDEVSGIASFFLKSKLEREAMSDQELWVLMGDFNETLARLEAEVPTLNYVLIDVKPAFQELRRMISTIQQQVQHRILTSLERDTSLLRGDLSRSMDLLQQQQPLSTSTLSLSSGGSNTLSLNLYLEQLTTVKTLSPGMLETLTQRLFQIKTLQQLLTNIPHKISQNIRELDQCLDKLPSLVRHCSDRLSKQRPQIESMLIQGCQSLAKKIRQFQDKYIERYVKREFTKESMDVMSVAGIRQEIGNRAKMIEEIKGKLKMHQECIEVVGVDEQISKHITCFKDLQSLEELHISNLGLWDTLQSLLDLEQSVLKTKLSDIASVLPKVDSFNLPPPPSPSLFDPLSTFLQDLFETLKTQLSLLKPLITTPFTPMHWRLLQDMLKYTGGPLDSVESLIKAKAYGADVGLVVKIAERDFKQQQMIKEYKEYVSGCQLEVKEEKIGQGIIRMIGMNEAVIEIIEEKVIQMSKLAKSQDTDIEIAENADLLAQQGNELKELLLRVRDCQKSIMSIRAFLVYEPLQKKFLSESKLFQEILRLFKDGISSTISSLQQFQENKDQICNTLESIEPIEDNLHQAIDAYFEQKRLLFPRLFFMTDKQCLEFIELCEQQDLRFNQFISLIFPGAEALLVDEVPCPPEGTSDLSLLESAIPQDIRKIVNAPQIEKGTVKGMISCHKELLSFTQVVPFNPSALAQTLQGVETAMQQTIGNLIGQAVGSFPRQSLDEWIMDYPLQTILTTIHLILTHEINELFSDVGRKGADDQVQQENSGQLEELMFDEYGRQMGQTSLMPLNERSMDNRGDDGLRARQMMDFLASHHRTPDTRDLVVATTSSHHHNKLPAHNHQRTISLQHLNEELFKSKHRPLPFGKSIAQQTTSHTRIKSCAQLLIGAKLDLRLPEEQYSPVKVVQIDDTPEGEEDSIAQDWRQFRADMFGWDFDLDKEQCQERNKEATMGVLQEKSFQGLYLRLQFWINQICKSLRLNLECDDEIKGSISHSPLQVQGMQTIINFLSYMRDVVYELRQKQVLSIDDFDWQKQIRLTWQGNQGDDTKGCKVECGAWQTYQANEYSGNFIQRLPITPLTNKYFIFIAAALREKSAVLFRGIPTHDYALDVYQEFANTCAVPLRSFHCAHPNVSMKSLMQFLNGAALASTWIFFEHIDKLCHLHLQTFNKEIQMVQQQFIIAELSQEDSEENNENGQEELPVPEGLNSSQQQISAVRQNFQSPFSIGVRTNQMGRRLGLKSKQQSPLETSQKAKRQDAGDDIIFSNRQSRYDDNQHYYDELPPPQMDSSQKRGKTQSQHSQQSKVSFGVFASMSHRFNIRHDKWAQDISVSLQSAFRVLSLTRPEFPLLTAMLMKSHGFIYHQRLSYKFHEAFQTILEEVLKPHIDDMSDHVTSITVRDIKRMMQASEIYLSTLKNDPAESYNLESISVSSVFRLWVREKMQGLVFEKKLDESILNKQITNIIAKAFEVESHTIDKSNVPQTLKRTVQESIKQRNLQYTSHEVQQIYDSSECLRESRALCIVGPARSGKHNLVNFIANDIIHSKPFFFDPSITGTFRELYGVADPLSIQSVVAIDQLGSVKHSLIEVIINDLIKTKGILVLTCDFNDPIFEAFLPYFEGSLSANHPKSIIVPNGMAIPVKEPLKIIFIAQSLSNASPRMVSSLHFHSIRTEIHPTHLVTKLFDNKFVQRSLNDVAAWLKSKMYSNPQILDYINAIFKLSMAFMKQSSTKLNQHELILVACVSILGINLEQSQRAELYNLPSFKDVKGKLPPPSAQFNFVNGKIEVFQDYSISNDFILSPSLQYASSLIIASGLSYTLQGQGKSTLIKHLSQDYPSSQVLLETPLLSLRTLRNLLESLKPRQSQTITLFVDDLSMGRKTILPYIKQLILNNLWQARPDQSEMLQLRSSGIQLINAEQNLKGSIIIKLGNPLQDSIFTEKLVNCYCPSLGESTKLQLKSLANQSSLRAIVQKLNNINARGQLQVNAQFAQLRFIPFNMLIHAYPGQYIPNNDSSAILDLELPTAFKSYSSLIDQLSSSLSVDSEIILIRLREALTLDPFNCHILQVFLESLQQEGLWKQWTQMANISIPWDQAAKVRSRIRIVIEQLQLNEIDQGILIEEVKEQTLDEVIADVSVMCQKLLIESSQNIPQQFIYSNERKIQLLSTYESLKARVRKSLLNQLSIQQAVQRKFSAHLDQQRILRQSDILSGQHSYKYQVTLMNLIGIKERLDTLTAKIRSLDSQIRVQSSELELLKDQLVSRRDQPQDFQEIVKGLKQYEDYHFQQLKNQLRDERMSQLIFTLSLACRSKRIFDIPFKEVCSRLEQAYNQQVSQEFKHAITQLRIPNKAEALAQFINSALIEISHKSTPKSSHYSIESMKKLISSLQNSLKLMKQQLVTSNDEAEELLIKESNLKKELDSLPRSEQLLSAQQSKDFKQDYIQRSIVKQGKSSEGKLDKIKLLLQRLEGDCLMVAASIVFLGIIPISKRMMARAQLQENLLLKLNLETSDCWKNTQSEQVHCNYFKRLLFKVLGGERPHYLPHSIIENFYAEFMVSYMLSTETIEVIDNSGLYINFLKQQNQNLQQLSSADQNSPEIIKERSSLGQKLIIEDLHSFVSPTPGRTQDLGTLISQGKGTKLVLNAPSHQLTDHSLLSKCTVFNASSAINKNEAWIDIKLTLLRHFLPETYQKLTVVLGQIRSLKSRIISQKVLFNQLYLTSSQSDELQQVYINFKQLEEDHAQFSQMFHTLINEHPLLASYSNILVIMYQSLKELSPHESTYSWDVYTKMINLIVAKVIRDLTLNMKKHTEDSQPHEENKEFTIDEDFFHTVIMPGIYNTVVSGIRQEHIALFNLIFAFEIALKKGSIEADEKAVFFKRFYKIEGFHEWRRGNGFNKSGEVNREEIIKEVGQVYPDLKKALMKIKDSKQLSFRDLLTSTASTKLPLLMQLLLGFLSPPDPDWRSKLTQFVYEELTTIFDFSEDLSKLHNFIKTASWNMPIALYTQNPINIVNTVCSIASYYGVGLEVLRTDSQGSLRGKRVEYHRNQEIYANIVAMEVPQHRNDEAAILHKHESQTPYQVHRRMFAKDEMDVEEKQLPNQQSQVELIKRCAQNGTWVLISTLRFPSYWSKVCKALSKMAVKGKIMNTFRIFFDLQGYSMGEIPESFAFDRAVKFYLTDKNGEDMEGFNDVWANILNDDLLNAKELTTQQHERQSIINPDESLILPDSITPGYLEDIIEYQRKKLVISDGVSGFGRDLESPVGKKGKKDISHDISGVSSIRGPSKKKTEDYTVNSIAQSFIFDKSVKEEHKEKPIQHIEMVSSQNRHPQKRLQPGQKHQSK